MNRIKNKRRSWEKRPRGRNGMGPMVLDKDSQVIFLRLKRRLPNLKDEEVIAHALRSLEHKTDRIIRKIAAKKARELRAEGISPENIAEQLNKNNVPPLGKRDQWSGADVAALQEGRPLSGEMTLGNGRFGKERKKEQNIS